MNRFRLLRLCGLLIGMSLACGAPAFAVCRPLQGAGHTDKVDETTYRGTASLRLGTREHAVAVTVMLGALSPRHGFVEQRSTSRFEFEDGSFFTANGTRRLTPTASADVYSFVEALKVTGGATGGRLIEEGSFDFRRGASDWTLGFNLCGFPSADVIYKGGPIVTLDDDQPSGEALAVQGKKIIAVGSQARIKQLRRKWTKLIDLGGQALLPGFVDAHDHIFNDADAVGLSLDEAQALALQNGITSLGDLFVKADFLDTMRAFEQAGNLKIRTSLYLRYNSSCGVVIGDWYLSETPVTDTSLMLRVPGIKVFTDGGSCGLPAVTFDMAGQDPPQGDLWITTPELTQVIVDAQTAGYQVAIHSVGDRSRDVALDALEAALGGQPNLLRHRIEHNTLTRPDQIARYGSIGVVAVIWGYSQTCRELAAGSDSWAIQLAPDRLDWYWPWRDLIDQNPGLHVAWHGDFFVSTPLSHLNPINSLYGFVTRKQVSEDDGVTICDPPPHLAAQLVTVQEALHMMTSGSAYALGMDSVVGSLTPGKFADFVVLSDDPFAVAPDDLKDLAVHATVVGGATEYCAAGQSTVCGN